MVNNLKNIEENFFNCMQVSLVGEKQEMLCLYNRHWGEARAIVTTERLKWFNFVKNLLLYFKNSTNSMILTPNKII